MDRSSSIGDGTEPAPIVVVVTRTGGFAGLRRQWKAEPAADEAPTWRSLIADCPWDDMSNGRTDAAPGADRFVWLIRAREDDDELEAELPDSALAGAWRELVDAVRAWPAGRPITAE